MIQFLRSLLFNIVFFSYTAFICIFLLWSLLLPRYRAWQVYNAYFKSVYWLEVLILGLKVKVEGLEHLPEDGKYIVAAKHQSAHETMIFPLLLHDPAIIMKKGLMQIPLWGWYAKKAGMIGVDRGGRQKAIASIVEGSKRIFVDNRPLIMFPQGTRTKLTDTTLNRPYKGGIAKIYQQVHCPIVPAALNTGVFWGRNSFIKKAGTATIKFLPPIPPDLPPDEMMKKLEQVLEPESAKLVEEAQAKLRDDEFKSGVADIFGIITLLILLWSGYWLYMAKTVEHAMLDMRAEMQQEGAVQVAFEGVSTSGYPFKIQLNIKNIRVNDTNNIVDIPALTAKAFPLPGYPITIESRAPIILKPLIKSQDQEFVIDYLGLEIENAVPPLFKSENEPQNYFLKSMLLKSGLLSIHAFGNISLDEETMAHNGEFVMTLKGYEAYIQDMIDKGVMQRAPSMFFLAMLKNQSEQWLEQARSNKRYDIPTLTQDAIIIPFSIRNNEIYAGMFKIGYIGTPLPEKSAPMIQDYIGDEPLQSRVPPAMQAYPEQLNPPVDINDLMNKQDFEVMRDNSIESLLEESESLPPSPNAIRND